MAITLATLIRGPANILVGATPYVYYSAGDVQLTMTKETFDITTSAHGIVDTRESERVVEISFTPAGEWETGPFEALFPGATTVPGTSWFGASTTANVLVIEPINSGQKYTFGNAKITKLPQLSLSAVKPMLGPVTFRAIDANDATLNLAWSSAASLYAVAAGSATEEAAFDPANVKTRPHIGVWGSVAGFTSIHTQDGWTVDFDLQLDPVNTDAYGVLDMTFRSMVVTARCMPIGPTEAQVHTSLGMQGTGSVRGRSLLAQSSALTIKSLDSADAASTNGVVAITKAALISIGGRFGTAALRHGEFVWRSTRSFTSGSPDAIFTLDTPA